MATEYKVFYLDGQTGSGSLKLSTRNISKPKADEVLIKHAAIGINFTDLEYIYGKRSLPHEQFTPGIEAAGTIVALGSDVKTYKIGQRVAYATTTEGGFAEYRTIAEKLIFPVHQDISYEAAVINLTKGMTAHYLMRRTFFVHPKMKVLIHGAFSHVAKLMLSLGKYYQAEIFATVSGQELVDSAKAIGYKEVFTYNDFDRLAQKHLFNVVYDGIGGDLLAKSAKCMQSFGLLASFGNPSGNFVMPNIEEMQQKSLFLTFPKLQHYKEDNRELYLSALEVFALIYAGVFPSIAAHKYSFEEIPIAIKNIAERKNLGPVAIIL